MMDMGPFQRTNNPTLKVSPPDVELVPPAQISSEMTTDLVGYSPSVGATLRLAPLFATARPEDSSQTRTTVCGHVTDPTGHLVDLIPKRHTPVPSGDPMKEYTRC